MERASERGRQVTRDAREPPTGGRPANHAWLWDSDGERRARLVCQPSPLLVASMP